LILLLLLLLLLSLLIFGFPSVAAEPAGNIRRTAYRDVRRFSPRQEVASKNPAGGANPEVRST